MAKRGPRMTWGRKPENAIQFKVALRYIRPPIWRRVVLPDNYTLVMSLQEPPMRWKIWDNATTADLINYGGITPGDMDMGHFWLQELVRWTGGPTVVAPAAGVAIYLDGATWVDSTGWRAWWAA